MAKKQVEKSPKKEKKAVEEIKLDSLETEVVKKAPIPELEEEVVGEDWNVIPKNIDFEEEEEIISMGSDEEEEE